MQRDRFLASRQERWEEMERLIKRSGPANVYRLSGDELLLLGRLYREATSDLAIARRDFPQDRLTVYLNGLVSRAHPLIYQQRAANLGQIGRFARYGFPAAYRAALPYTALALGVFVLAALISALLVARNPSLTDLLMPGQAQELRSVMEQHHLWMKSAASNHSVAANFIMLNNIKVAFFAFAGGMLLGLGTLYVMALNGIVLGTIGAMVEQYRLSLPFWSFVVPHGVIELSVIFIAGGAGMMIGDAILHPGLISRDRAVVRAARQAGQLIAGCVPLLVIAGTIEAFFSPSDAPVWLKLLVGGIELILLYAYLLGSRPPAQRESYRFEDVIVA